MPPPPAPSPQAQGYPQNQPLPNSPYSIHPQQQHPPPSQLAAQTQSSFPSIQSPTTSLHYSSHPHTPQQPYPYPGAPSSVPSHHSPVVYPQQVQHSTPTFDHQLSPSHPQAAVIYQQQPQAQQYYQQQPQIYATPGPADAYQHFDGSQPSFLPQQGYLSPHQQFIAPSPSVPSPGVAVSPGIAVSPNLAISSPAQLASPAWQHPDFQLQQQQPQAHQQPPQQQADLYFAQSQPFAQSLPAAGPATPSTALPLPPSFQPAPAPAPVSGDNIVKVPPRITLKVRANAGDNEMPGGRTRSSAAVVKTEPERQTRATRSGRAAAVVSYAEEDRDDEEDYRDDDDDDDDDEVTQPPRKPTRRQSKMNVDDGNVYGQGDADGEEEAPEGPPVGGPRRSSRAHRPPKPFHGADDFEDSIQPDSSPGATAYVALPDPPTVKRTTRRRVVMDPDEEDDFKPHANGGGAAMAPERVVEQPLSQRSRSKRRGSEDDAESFNPSESEQTSSSETEADHLDNFVEEPDDDDADSFVDHTPPRKNTRNTRQTRSAAVRNTRSRRADPDSDEEFGKKRSLRKRDTHVDYKLPDPDFSAELAKMQAEEAIAQAAAPRRGPGRRPGPAARLGAASRFGSLPSAFKHFAQRMGDPDSSDSDNDLMVPKAGAAGAAGPVAALGGGAGGPGAAGIPRPSDVPNFGRVNPKSNMADADPLGVDVNVTFDRVGGLDGHINQLKEMVALPLLYPELFQQFGIIPPRGVLFHGPPGTGKTLLARALAASCSNGNQKIAFFMRKGADVLSKWVGEAERQLRMLFEEARASQPSIIFFDEIDGLAPVRSSKQDQIHASLVSTLLALMDGMDGRGQVIVIGATNRPDSVDPALRRPGRFDREFYFPLPNRDARRQIIGINTRAWEPQLPDAMLDTLATLTKGYGGADLRALCTEAALNAIQRKYPQIYKATDRLQVQPGSVRVMPKDFMLAVKKIVPSSARSASSAAIQLPSQLVPLLSPDLERLKTALDLALPRVKKRTALEEAEFEDDDGDSFEKEIMLQSLDQMRTYRPRLLVHGPQGAGQIYLGPAILHHLEGFHVQSFDLATLMGDSTRTPEAAIVQMFVEAKRHQPSIIFIPSLAQWSETLSETARSTTRALLDGISPSDPVLLLAIVDGSLATLPSDVRAWFGYSDENRIELGTPTLDQRGEFFAELIDTVQRPPTAFPDGVPRKKRVLEELPLAAPLPPRQPTEAEILRDEKKENEMRNLMHASFASLLNDLCKKYNRPQLLLKEEVFGLANYLAEQAAAEQAAAEQAAAEQVATSQAPAPAEGIIGAENINGDPPAGVVQVQVTEAPQAMVMAQLDPTVPIPVAGPSAEQPAAAAAPEGVALIPAVGAEAPAHVAVVPRPPVLSWTPHDMDTEIIRHKLNKHKYYTPGDVMADFLLIEENLKHSMDEERKTKVAEMLSLARLHVTTFDDRYTPDFEWYSQRMRARKAERAKARAASQAASRAATRHGSIASGTGSGSGAATAPSAIPAPDGVSGAVANGKRDREDDDGANGDERAKRPRDDTMDVDPPNAAVDSILNGESSLDTKTDLLESIEPTQITETQSTTPEAEATVTGAVGVDKGKGKEKESEKPRTPSPEIVYPPLVVPEDDLERLSRALRHSTGKLNVEQLEQLRASLLDKVWRARKEWDRTAVLASMRESVSRFVAEAAEAEAMAKRAAAGEYV